MRFYFFVAGIIMRRFLSIAFNAAREILRQPIVLILALACVVTIWLLPVVAVFCLGQEERIVRDGALASCFVYGLFLVVACSVASISRQIQNGTAASVLSKPVGREVFLAASYCGIGLVVAAFILTGILASLLSVRMAVMGILTDWLVGIIFLVAMILAFASAAVANFRGHNFCSSSLKALPAFLALALFIAAFLNPAGGFLPFGETGHGQDCSFDYWASGVLTGRHAVFGGFICWKLLLSGLLLFCALAMLAAIALALSIRFKPVVVLFCCSLVFFVGLLSDYLFFTLAGGQVWAQVCSAILPNWQSLGIYEALDLPLSAVWRSMLQACGYTFFYICALLCLGFLSFREAEI